MNIYQTMMSLLAMLLIALLATQASAGENRESHASTMKHEQGFMAIRNIDGVHSVIFHVMRAPDGSGFSRDEYHLMVSIEKNKKPLSDLVVSSEVIHPDGSRETRDHMVQLKGWYMARYNLVHEQGQHLITVRFTDAGKHYRASIYYPE